MTTNHKTPYNTMSPLAVSLLHRLMYGCWSLAQQFNFLGDWLKDALDFSGHLQLNCQIYNLEEARRLKQHS